jgi:hypothetical protein
MKSQYRVSAEGWNRRYDLRARRPEKRLRLAVGMPLVVGDRPDPDESPTIRRRTLKVTSRWLPFGYPFNGSPWPFLSPRVRMKSNAPLGYLRAGLIVGECSEGTYVSR